MRLAAGLFLALAALPVSAQGFLSPAPAGMRTITVQGRGSVTAPSDHAVVRFQVRTEGATLDEALGLHGAEVARVQGLLRAAGVPESRVTLDRVAVGDVDAGDEDEYGSAPDAPTETVTVSRAITAEVDDLDAVDGLVGSLATRRGDDALTTQLRSVVVSFERRETAALRETALRDAVSDARRRAQISAEASGVSVGRVLSVTEGGVTGSLLIGAPSGGSAAGAGRVAALMGGLMGGGAGQHTEEATVVVVFLAE